MGRNRPSRTRLCRAPSPLRLSHQPETKRLLKIGENPVPKEGRIVGEVFGFEAFLEVCADFGFVKVVENAVSVVVFEGAKERVDPVASLIDSYFVDGLGSILFHNRHIEVSGSFGCSDDGSVDSAFSGPGLKIGDEEGAGTIVARGFFRMVCPVQPQKTCKIMQIGNQNRLHHQEFHGVMVMG